MKAGTCLLVTLLVGSGLGYAQVAQPVQPPPEPGADAAQPAEATQPEQAQEYGGPSIISRDSALVGERGGKLLDFRVWGALSGLYDSGLTPVTTNQAGQLVNLQGDYAVQASFGAMGSKQWTQQSLSLEYVGSYRHYSSNSKFDGTDQFLDLRYGRYLTRHLILDVKVTGGTSSLANGEFSYLPLTAIDLTTVPANDLFDNRIYYASSRAGLIWRKSARLSFSVSGQGFIVRRQAISLAGVDGYIGTVDAAYRLTRRQTLSVAYSYTQFDYQRVFGFAHVQTLSLGYAVAIARRLEASFSVGGSYAETRGLAQTVVPPAIAAIIGQSTVISNFDRFITVPYLAGTIIRRLNRAAVTVKAHSGVSPGNGVYLTSRETAVTGGYSYVGFRRWTMGANVGYSELSPLGQTLGKYRNYAGGVGATYKLNSPLHLEFRYDYRHYTTANDFFRKDSHRVSIGIAFSPGETPLALW